eukprot:14633-Rhodomonas_salina.1
MSELRLRVALRELSLHLLRGDARVALQRQKGCMRRRGIGVHGWRGRRVLGAARVQCQGHRSSSWSL